MPSRTSLNRGRLAALGGNAVGLLLELHVLDQLAWQELGVARVGDGHPLEHLPHDDLDMLVVDVDALVLVDPLNLAHKVHLDGLAVDDLEQLLGVGRALGYLVARCDLVAVRDQQLQADGYLVLVVLGKDLAVLGELLAVEDYVVVLLDPS